MQPIPVPRDVVDYIRSVFLGANRRTAAKLMRMPTLHEETLDFTFIEGVSDAVGPHVLSSGTVVDVDMHWVGSGTHWERWEVADIGLIFNFRVRSEILRTKIALLQSKRIYPRESEFSEERGLTRLGGFGSLMSSSPLLPYGPRVFRFDASCRYKALQVGDRQWSVIAEYERAYGIPVHYLLYHPTSLPATAEIPATPPASARTRAPSVGTRVLSAIEMRASMHDHPRNYAPAYQDIRSAPRKPPGLSVQDFICDEVLACRQGYVAEAPDDDPGLRRVFTQRAAPIAAAIRFDIILAEEAVEE